MAVDVLRDLPVGAVAVAIIWLEFPYFRPEGMRRIIDWSGVATLMGFLVPLLLALTWAPESGWLAAKVLGSLVFSAVMLAVFLWVESRAPEPLLPLKLFRDPVIAVSSAALFLLGMSMFGIIVYLPLFMQAVLGISATQSGSLLTPLMLAAVAGSAITGQIVSRTGKYKKLSLFASAVLVAGAFLMAWMDAGTTEMALLRNMILVGIGLGVLPPIYSLAVQNAAPREHLGAATASTQFFRSIGSTVGVAIGGSVLLAIFHSSFAQGVPPGTPARASRHSTIRCCCR